MNAQLAKPTAKALQNLYQLFPPVDEHATEEFLFCQAFWNKSSRLTGKCVISMWRFICYFTHVSDINKLSVFVEINQLVASLDGITEIVEHESFV